MDHSKNPRNKGLKEGDGYVASKVNNPSCGDKIVIQIRLKDGIVEHIGHDGSGCTICCASASILAANLQGSSVGHCRDVIDNFSLMQTKSDYDQNVLALEMQALKGVSDFPARIKCVMLPYQALKQALDKPEEEK
jgi:nitrogen fixation NifU-like protein